MDHDHHGHEHADHPKGGTDGSAGAETGMREHGQADHAAHDMHEGHRPGEHAGHDEHAGHSVAMFRDRFWLSLLLTIPVLVWSEMVQEWLRDRKSVV